MTLLLLVLGIAAFLASPFLGWPLLFIAFILSIAALYKAFKIKGNGWGRAVIVVVCGIFALAMTVYALQFILFLTGVLYRSGLSS